MKNTLLFMLVLFVCSCATKKHYPKKMLKNNHVFSPSSRTSRMYYYNRQNSTYYFKW